MKPTSPYPALLVSDLHHTQRPRERLLRCGPAQLSDAELLAVLLGAGAAGLGVIQLAQHLILRFDGLYGVLAADIEQLLSCKGVGLAGACRIKALAELSQRESQTVLNRAVQLSDVAQVGRFLQQRVGHLSREVFGCLFLDSRHCLIEWEVLFKGSLNRAHVHAREVLRRSLQLNAAAVVLAHNHPSGAPEPSQADLVLTQTLSHLLAQVEVVVLDHIVVGRAGYVSMVSRGLFAAKV